MKEYLLGIDIGTSACKVAAFRFDGTVVASASAEYPVFYPKEGWAEQNPEDWWMGVCRSVKQIIASGDINADEIAGIGVAGQSWSAVAMDANGKVLTNNPSWMDFRAQSICDRLNRIIGADTIFKAAGNSLQPSYTTTKILWYQENLPEVFEQIDTILQCNSFIVQRLTGQKTMDISQGYGLHCFNLRTGKWDDRMCDKMGIPRSFLPEISECCEVVGTVTPEAAALTSLSAGIPVVAGGLDAACATLGAGVVEPGETQEQGGQAGGMSICLDTFYADPRLILGYHAVPGKWLLQGGTTGGSGTMRWFEHEFAEYERSIAEETGVSSLIQLNQIAAEVPAGSEGLVFLPYMSGERSPIWDPLAKGVFYGVDFAKTKGHFVRAVMEGVAFSLRHNLDIAGSCGAHVDELRAVGGAANSLLWTQIKADVTGKPIKVPASDIATTLGAAILAGVGVGVYSDCETAAAKTIHVTRTHQPNPENRNIYEQSYRIYLELYEQLKETMKKQGDEQNG